MSRLTCGPIPVEARRRHQIPSHKRERGSVAGLHALALLVPNRVLCNCKNISTAPINSRVNNVDQRCDQYARHRAGYGDMRRDDSLAYDQGMK